MSFKRIYNSARSELIEHKKIRIISLILIMFFGIVQFRASYSLSYRWYDITYFPFLILMFVLFVVCKNVFKDMYDNTAADVQMSLPLSSRERYFSHLLTIGIIFYFPFLIITTFFNILSFLYFSFCYYVNIQNSVGPYYEEMPDISVCFKYNLIIAAVALFVIAVTAFSLSCVGSKSEAVYIPILLTFVFSLLPFLFLEFVSSKFLIYSPNVENVRLLKMIPGFAIIFFQIDDVSVFAIIVNIVLSVVVIFLGLASFERRDVQSVGKPVVNRVFYEFLLFLSSIIIFMVSYSDDSIGFFAFINVIGIIGMIILRVIGSRKEFHATLLLKWIGLYVLYYVAFIAVMFAFCKTNMFGMAKNLLMDDGSGDRNYSCDIDVFYENKEWRYYVSYNVNYFYYSFYENENNFYIKYPNVKHQKYNMKKYDEKGLAKLLAKYNYISVNKPEYFSNQMFFTDKSFKTGVCALYISVYKEKGDEYSIPINSIFLDDDDYETLQSELFSLAHQT